MTELKALKEKINELENKLFHAKRIRDQNFEECKKIMFTLAEKDKRIEELEKKLKDIT